MKKSLGVLIDELFTVNKKLWYAQETITTSQDDLEVAVASRKAQELNAKRNRLMRAIDESVGQLEDSVTEKTYDKSTD